MAIPDFQSLMLPVLKLAGDGSEHKFRDAVDQLAEDSGLTNEERSEMLPSGTQALFTNRVGWARTYLKQAGLIDSPRRGYFHITDEGRAFLAKNPIKISISDLQQFDRFRRFRARRHEKKNDDETQSAELDIATETPEDSLAAAYRTLRKNLEQELLETVTDSSPTFFERMVVDLLVKMGYGGNRQDAGRALGKSGDGGIDGIIKEDRLGLDVIYIQAKKWDGTVGRPEIQKFAGALQGQRAKKGVFITTSAFSKEATEYAAVIDSKIILIDGSRLADLMVEHNVGVSVVGNYEVKKLDSDYFYEE